jgi:hypothetical protein
LLKAEKELTRRSDELARRRQELAWVRIDKKYRFETDEWTASLADLFRGRSQLLVYHFMFGPEMKEGARNNSGRVDLSVGCSNFPREIVPAPRSWAERFFPNLIHWNKLDSRRPFRRVRPAGALYKRTARLFSIFALTL